MQEVYNNFTIYNGYKPQQRILNSYFNNWIIKRVHLKDFLFSSLNFVNQWINQRAICGWKCDTKGTRLFLVQNKDGLQQLCYNIQTCTTALTRDSSLASVTGSGGARGRFIFKGHKMFSANSTFTFGKTCLRQWNNRMFRGTSPLQRCVETSLPCCKKLLTKSQKFIQGTEKWGNSLFLKYANTNMGQNMKNINIFFFPFVKEHLRCFKVNLVLLFFCFYFVFKKKGPRKNKIKMACVSLRCIISMQRRLLLHIWKMKSLLLCSVTHCSCGSTKHK